MEADDADDAARFETVVQDAAQRGFELLELAIDGDAQGLKDLSCRVALPWRAGGVSPWILL